MTPAKRGKGNKQKRPDEAEERTPTEHQASMTWAQCLKRVFNIDMEICSQCDGPVKVIASIEDPQVIKKILDHLKARSELQDAVLLPDARAPPQATLFD